MYTLLLIVHSWLRWGVIIAGLLAAFMLVTRRAAGHVPNASHPGDRWGLFFMIFLDLQLLVGLLLYFVVSPNMSAIRANMAASMRDPVARFWAVEHITAMLVAVVGVHVGRVLSRKAANPDSRRRRMLIGVSLAMLAILWATPWPGRPAGRPMFRVSAQP